ncbi:hypothetical protein XELAEV_18019873mg [Xenopus laevis]|uniref:Uncharacterized protein n=1 Tax=Xenopus laevis TaxID=8355 RepID=A0A974HQ33_XENLA|nr:hypothetical protein XELAEV_18019873mg [Xenopus laevis]
MRHFWPKKLQQNNQISVRFFFLFFFKDTLFPTIQSIEVIYTISVCSSSCQSPFSGRRQQRTELFWYLQNVLFGHRPLHLVHRKLDTNKSVIFQIILV